MISAGGRATFSRDKKRAGRKKQRQSDDLMRRGERKRHFRGKRSGQVLPPPSLCFVADVGSAFGLPMNFRHDDDLIGTRGDVTFGRSRKRKEGRDVVVPQPNAELFWAL